MQRANISHDSKMKKPKIPKARTVSLKVCKNDGKFANIDLLNNFDSSEFTLNLKVKNEGHCTSFKSKCYWSEPMF